MIKNSFFKYIAVVLMLIITISIVIMCFTNSYEFNDKEYKSAFSKNNLSLQPLIPNTIIFANEFLPLNKYYVSESIEREIIVNSYWHSNTLLLLKRANRFLTIIEKILNENNIPNDFKYIVLIESGLENIISNKDAVGYWQLLESTAKEYGLEVNSNVDERYCIEKSTNAACKYFNRANKLFNNWILAAASYNCGISRISAAIDNQKINNFFDLYLNNETTRYIYRAIALKLIYENPVNYGFILRQKDLYPPLDIYKIQIDTTINDLYNFAAQNGVSYKILKEFNPWLRESKLLVKNSKTYTIKLPKTIETNMLCKKHDNNIFNLNNQEAIFKTNSE